MVNIVDTRRIVSLDDTIAIRYYITDGAMIVNFKCKETEKIFNREWSGKFPPEIQERTKDKLRMLNYVITLHQLQLPKSNHLKELKGKKRGQYSIRINNQWRICFEWHSNYVYNVEIVDYH